MKIDKIDIDGKKNSIEVLDKIISGKINKKLVDLVLYKTNANYKKRKAKTLLKIIATNPYPIPPPYEKLVGDLEGAYSRRINIQHRLVYQVLENIQTIKVLRMWTHYE